MYPVSGVAFALSDTLYSFILHIDSSDDAEPWPIFIEDFHGQTHEVVLHPGAILFYESSKCYHGRPRPFSGSWYTSLFVHYYPAQDWPHDVELEAHYAVPPSWSSVLPQNPDLPVMKMVDTSFTEPSCPDSWCGTIDTIKWNKPAEHGILLTPGFERLPFTPALVDEEAEEL